MDTNTERLIHLIKTAQETYSKEFLVIVVPEFLSKKFVSYCSMKEDLELVIEYINQLRENPPGIMKSALTYSTISLYGKCFTDATEKVKPKLEPTSVFAEAEHLLDRHNYLMNLRHQFIAHRGETDSEVGISYMLVPKADDDPDNTQIRFSQLKLTGFSEEDMAGIEAIVKHLILILSEKIQKNGQKVYDRMLKLFKPEALALMLLNSAK